MCVCVSYRPLVKPLYYNLRTGTTWESYTCLVLVCAKAYCQPSQTSMSSSPLLSSPLLSSPLLFRCGIWGDFLADTCDEIQITFSLTVSYFLMDGILLLIYRGELWGTKTRRDRDGEIETERQRQRRMRFAGDPPACMRCVVCAVRVVVVCHDTCTNLCPSSCLLPSSFFLLPTQ